MLSNEKIASVIRNSLSLEDGFDWENTPIPTEELVGQPRVLKYLTGELASQIVESGLEFDFVAGRVANGMAPGWLLREDLEQLLGKEIPFVYIREAKKKGGHAERITGHQNNPFFEKGKRALLVDIGGLDSLGTALADRVVDSSEVLNGAGFPHVGTATFAECEPFFGRVHSAQSRFELMTSQDLSLVEPFSVDLPYDIPEVGDVIDASTEDIGKAILDAGALDIRDVPFLGKEGGGKDPFLYASSNRGPGYVMVKGQVGRPKLMDFLCYQLAKKIHDAGIEFDFVAGNVTGGVIPGWKVRDYLERLQGREIPYVFVKGTRADLSTMTEQDAANFIVGHKNNPNMKKGMTCVIVEELANFAQTTSASAGILRKAGYETENGSSILFYDHAQGHANLERAGLNMTAAITLPELLEVGESSGHFKPDVVDSYRNFLSNPTIWQLEHGFVPPEKDLKNYFGENYRAFMEKCAEHAREMKGDKK